MKYKMIFLISILLLFVGCTQPDIENLLRFENGSFIFEGAITTTFEQYLGEWYYCFYSDYKQKEVCMPYTETTWNEFMVPENITIWEVCHINGSCRLEVEWDHISESEEDLFYLEVQN